LDRTIFQKDVRRQRILVDSCSDTVVASVWNCLLRSTNRAKVADYKCLARKLQDGDEKIKLN